MTQIKETPMPLWFLTEHKYLLLTSADTQSLDTIVITTTQQK